MSGIFTIHASGTAYPIKAVGDFVKLNLTDPAHLHGAVEIRCQQVLGNTQILVDELVIQGDTGSPQEFYHYQGGVMPYFVLRENTSPGHVKVFTLYQHGDYIKKTTVPIIGGEVWEIRAGGVVSSLIGPALMVADASTPVAHVT